MEQILHDIVEPVDIALRLLDYGPSNPVAGAMKLATRL